MSLLFRSLLTSATNSTTTPLRTKSSGTSLQSTTAGPSVLLRLLASGFLHLRETPAHETRWKPIFSVAELGGSNRAAQYAVYIENENKIKKQKASDLETCNNQIEAASPLSEGNTDFKKELSEKGKPRVVIVNGFNRPFFHTDLTSALRIAIENIEAGYGAASEVTLATALDLQEH
ncbi:hypothetical protein BKA61DRAFT_702273 [Leptodontidium sp. MPI-SDFR-AT-0119]|nr:hypothetical protein BKA61DRAFT_702273 [Leptodontidium sp. MPI-SDFR-AT-0119]